jgi:hypothetical protein
VLTPLFAELVISNCNQNGGRQRPTCCELMVSSKQVAYHTPIEKINPVLHVLCHPKHLYVAQHQSQQEQQIQKSKLEKEERGAQPICSFSKLVGPPFTATAAPLLQRTERTNRIENQKKSVVELRFRSNTGSIRSRGKRTKAGDLVDGAEIRCHDEQPRLRPTRHV